VPEEADAGHDRAAGCPAARRFAPAGPRAGRRRPGPGRAARVQIHRRGIRRPIRSWIVRGPSVRGAEEPGS
jgi:hypothetical protein